MSERKDFTCIVCPRGCALTVLLDGGKVQVGGFACPKGEAYGRQEATEPLRSLTTTVRTDDPAHPRLAVKTDGELPLARVREAMAALNGIVARSPVRHGAVLMENLLGLGINLIAGDDLMISARPGRKGDRHDEE